MVEPIMKWGCCQLTDQTEEFFQCDRCKKAFDYKCLALDLFRELTAWTCPICISKTPNVKNNDNTPVRFNPNITVRNNKRPALQSPPDPSPAPITENGIRAIIEDVIGNQMETLLGKFTLTMRTMLNNELKSMREEIKDIRDSVSFIGLQYEDILKKSKEEKQKIKELKEQNESMLSTMNDMSTRLNNLEQQTRASNLEIQCVSQKTPRLRRKKYFTVRQ
ncbi:unnamed protein product [Euphydryas editha]|uniref:Zinc finger PHD-type domain-containing protein n=1 Tax=Euphydryas editha TaxID=104508 RepID=A0AAU9UDV9_EUPED|nr:unnamed protein product [Euphydryas editha]